MYSLRVIVAVQRIRGFGDNALYKSTFYLLTYLLTYLLGLQHWSAVVV